MKKPILILIIIGIIVNAVFFIVFGSRVDWRQDYFIGEGDTAEYYLLAKNMLAGNGFSFSESPPYFPTRFRTPAYPLFIAAILAVAKNVFAVLIFQNILTILSAVILYLIARSLFGKGKLAFGLAVIFLLDPLILRHQNSLMSETVFVLLILLGFYYFWKYFEKNNIADVIFSGFFIGLAALTKPIAQFLPLVLAVILIFWGIKRKIFKKIIFLLMIFFAIFSLTVAPWLIRNKIVFGDTRVSSVDLYNLYYVNAATVLAFRDGKSWKSVQGELLAAAQKSPYSRNIDYYFATPVSPDLGAQAIEIFLKHPRALFRMYALGVARHLFDDGGQELGYALSKGASGGLGLSAMLARGNIFGALEDVFSRRASIVIPFIFGKIIWVPLWLSIFYGVWNLRKENDFKLQFILCLAVILIAYFALLSVPGSESRLRMPSIPLLLVLAGYGASKLYEKKSPLNLSA